MLPHWATPLASRHHPSRTLDIRQTF